MPSPSTALGAAPVRARELRGVGAGVARVPHVRHTIPIMVSKEARVRLDTNTHSVPPKYVGK